jgi:hypothetical protein
MNQYDPNNSDMKHINMCYTNHNLNLIQNLFFNICKQNKSQYVANVSNVNTMETFSNISKLFHSICHIKSIEIINLTEPILLVNFLTLAELHRFIAFFHNYNINGKKLICQLNDI